MENGLENITPYERKLRRRWYAHRLTTLREDEDEIKLMRGRHTAPILYDHSDILWKTLESGTLVIRYDDIPWIPLDDPIILAIEKNNKEARRKAQMRWHPDSFTQKFGARLHSDDYEKIMKKVTETFQTIMSALQ